MISKPFKTLDNQIDILISRGLVVSDKEVTKSILLRENYYNVINGYKDIFLDKSYGSSEKFIENTNFNEIYQSSPDSCVKCYTMFLPFLLIKIDVFS